MTLIVQPSQTILIIEEDSPSSIVVSQQINALEVAAFPPSPTLEFFGEGPQGATGAGVSSGGDPGNILIKNSYSNYDTSWTATVDGGTFN